MCIRDRFKIDKIMKKFVFAAMVMVSVSNVFASSKMMIDNSEVVPVDSARLARLTLCCGRSPGAGLAGHPLGDTPAVKPRVPVRPVRRTAVRRADCFPAASPGPS